MEVSGDAVATNTKIIAQRDRTVTKSGIVSVTLVGS